MTIEEKVSLGNGKLILLLYKWGQVTYSRSYRKPDLWSHRLDATFVAFNLKMDEKYHLWWSSLTELWFRNHLPIYIKTPVFKSGCKSIWETHTFHMCTDLPPGPVVLRVDIHSRHVNQMKSVPTALSPTLCQLSGLADRNRALKVV